MIEQIDETGNWRRILDRTKRKELEDGTKRKELEDATNEIKNLRRRMGKTILSNETWKPKPKSSLGNLAGGFLSIAIANEALRNAMEPLEPIFEERTAWDYSYGEKKRNAMNKILKGLKGGNRIMETKSRYEVISELEKQKRELIWNRDNLKESLKDHEKELKQMLRELEDKKEEIKEYKDSMKDKETTFNTLIKSVDDSLNRFNKLEQTKK
ncbi:MAG TPA: hypothetical protein VMZ91_07160 [Candidatus Paceibacterota bacterium]|nr:hypothetical protein [Candidatus Paceibacterota bacterium]